MKFTLITFGCRVNQADAGRIDDELRALGGSSTTERDADLVIVNTCSVTASADQAARQAIRRIGRTNPLARIVVTGCYATRAPSELQALPGVVRVIPNPGKDELVATLEPELTTASRVGGEGPCGGPPVDGFGGRTAFTLRVQTGCADACSYCVIPQTRGLPRSRAVRDVVHVVCRAADAGFKEIVLTGVHLGSYGRDLEPRTSLLDLVRRLVDGVGSRDILFRLSSIEPMDCPFELVDLVAASGVIAPHVHLPLQHASDAMLRAMRRPYRLARYRRLVDRVRTMMPHASIGTDVIAGFPGETDAEFRELVTYLSGSPLTHVHVFPYSPRPDTVAARLPDRVAPVTVRARAAELRATGRDLADRFRTGQVGSVRRALTLDSGSGVVTDNYLRVPLSETRSRNQWLWVRLCGHSGTLTAEPVRRPVPTSVEPASQLLRRGPLRPLDDELSAGRPDVASAALAHRHRHVMVGERPSELIDTAVVRSLERNPGRLVERDEVDLRSDGSQQSSQSPGVVGRVVDTSQ